jgi:hypothetical protein
MWFLGEMIVRSYKRVSMSLASRAAAQPVPSTTKRGRPVSSGRPVCTKRAWLHCHGADCCRLTSCSANLGVPQERQVPPAALRPRHLARRPSAICGAQC